MADTRLELAINTLRRIEDATTAVEPTSFGGIHTCVAAPSLHVMNLVRVDTIKGDLARIGSRRRERQRTLVR